jgi:hypothetical protein
MLTFSGVHDFYYVLVIVCHCLNRAASDGQLPLTITAFHRNLLGTDDFLGQATISLDQFKPNDKPRSGYVD